MIRLYQKDNTSKYKDFENHLFTTHVPVFDFDGGTVEIGGIIYLLDYSTGNDKIIELLYKISASIPSIDNSPLMAILQSIETKLSVTDKVMEIPVIAKEQKEFTLPGDIKIIKQLLAITENLPLMCGLNQDYHINANTLYFHSYFELDAGEKLLLIYQ
jgi:hypothetical protein